MHFKPVDIAIIAVFSAIWAVLNLTVGPLGFTLFQLPIFCDFSVYFTLLLATWASGKIGTPSAVGITGAFIVLAMRPGSMQMIGFSASAFLFDILMILCKHEVRLKPYNFFVASIATMASAYFAGVIIGTVFMGRALGWALTFWGVWHLIGGVIGLVIAMPVVGVLEKVGVKGAKSA
ncbi:MAG: hypothetical protein NZ932_06620 [Candidatus Bathyarchaeota archaeon]|nr:hypothetical protein [Candidatus Bathyarchaeota archaeon]MDW8040320.1 hypothetical protein [Nitrososphaerota archaeon]